jgi:hypothetical protein
MDRNDVEQPTYDDQRMQSFDHQGLDVTEDSPLPDIPDAGPDSRPLVPPEPVDISTRALNTGAALTAGTFDDGAGRTLYEQAIDAYEESDAGDPVRVPQSMSGTSTVRRRTRIYDNAS